MMKSSLSIEVIANNLIDYITLRSNLSTNKTIRFTKKPLFYTIVGFTQSHSGVLGDIEAFIRKIPYKSDKPINITGIDEIHLKCGFINRSIVNVIREPNLYSFALDKSRDHKIHKEPRTKHLKRKNKSVLSHFAFSLEDDDHTPGDFNGETVSIAGQLVKLCFFVNN